MKITPADMRFLEYRLSARWRRLLPPVRPAYHQTDPKTLARRALMDAINARGEIPGHGEAGNAMTLLRTVRRNLASSGVTTSAGREVRTLEQYMRALCTDTGERRARLYRRWLRAMARARARAQRGA